MLSGSKLLAVELCGLTQPVVSAHLIHCCYFFTRSLLFLYAIIFCVLKKKKKKDLTKNTGIPYKFNFVPEPVKTNASGTDLFFCFCHMENVAVNECQ